MQLDADGVPAWRLTDPEADPAADAGRLLLYLHGGGYQLGSLHSHGPLAVELGRATGRRVLLPEYPLAPEHPFPAAVEDTLTTWRWIVADGTDPASVVIAGDSAGGGLALTLLQSLRDAGERLPAGAVLISPFLDLTASGASLTGRAGQDPVFTPDAIRRFAAVYLNGADPRDPAASPLLGSQQGLPPLLIQAGGAAVVGKMIKNPAYRGHYWMTRVERDPETGQVVWSGKWEHSCEALIDARRFRLANEALARREKRGPKGDPASRAMLRGAIRCPDCEVSPMNKIKTRASNKAGSGTITYYRCWGTGSWPKGCGNMVRMDVADAAVNQIMATTFRVPVKRLILIKGSDHQDELEEISHRIRELDPDVMTDEQYDAELARLRAERDRLKALPAEPDRWEEQLTGELYADIYQALPVHERGAWLKSHGFVIHATKKEVSVIQGDVRGTAHLG